MSGLGARTQQHDRRTPAAAPTQTATRSERPASPRSRHSGVNVPAMSTKIAE